MSRPPRRRSMKTRVVRINCTRSLERPSAYFLYQLIKDLVPYEAAYHAATHENGIQLSRIKR
jgi:hypothetical protein